MADWKFFLSWALGLKQPETQTSPREQVALLEYARGRKIIAEIGVYHGVNTLRFREAMRHSGILFAVDHFPRSRVGLSWAEIISRYSVSKSSNGTVIFMRQLSSDAAITYANTQEKKVEFLFVDGDHSWDGIQADWQGWRSHIAAGGVVAFHDSRETADSPPAFLDGSIRFVREVVGNDPDFELIDVVESTTFFRRRVTAADTVRSREIIVSKVVETDCGHLEVQI